MRRLLRGPSRLFQLSLVHLYYLYVIYINLHVLTSQSERSRCGKHDFDLFCIGVILAGPAYIFSIFSECLAFNEWTFILFDFWKTIFCFIFERIPNSPFLPSSDQRISLAPHTYFALFSPF